MTTVNIKIPFESLDNNKYIMYIERAEMLHEMDLLLDKSVVQLAKQLYERDIMNED